MLCESQKYKEVKLIEKVVKYKDCEKCSTHDGCEGKMFVRERNRMGKVVYSVKGADKGKRSLQ